MRKFRESFRCPAASKCSYAETDCRLSERRECQPDEWRDHLQWSELYPAAFPVRQAGATVAYTIRRMSNPHLPAKTARRHDPRGE